MMRNLQYVRDPRRGAALVELALNILLFLTLVLGAFEISRAIWTYTTVSHATKQGVRYAMIHGADNAGISSSGTPMTQSDVDEEIKDVVKANAPGLDASKLTVVTTWTPNNVPGSTVRVSVQYPFDSMFGPLAPSMSGAGIKTEYKMIVTN